MHSLVYSLTDGQVQLPRGRNFTQTARSYILSHNTAEMDRANVIIFSADKLETVMFLQ